jgi:hypothetical protein
MAAILDELGGLLQGNPLIPHPLIFLIRLSPHFFGRHEIFTLGYFHNFSRDLMKGFQKMI